jgi:NADPH:quinone reductase-like Zn-dependent oxidoreductase
MYPREVHLPIVPGSDAAGEVVEVGSKITQWKKGDKVLTLFNQGHQYGDLDLRTAATDLGGHVDGTLRQYGVFNENGLVRAPSNLNWLEAGTLSCAALTAWNALYGLKQVKPGDYVLVQGTGGVSMFALQFAKAAGAKVIATTSSADKVETVKKLGADHVINYRDDKEWGKTARSFTPNGDGVDHIVEVGGQDTMGQSLNAIKYGGVISVIGVLAGFQPKESALEALFRVCILRGVMIGSRAQFQDMVRAIEANDIHPVLDKTVFSFEDVKKAYEYQVSNPLRQPKMRPRLTSIVERITCRKAGNQI